MTERIRDDLWEGEMRGCVLSGKKILLIKLDGQVFAYDDRCEHLGLLLSEGRLERGILTCRGHHWQYDIRTGHGTNPKTACLRRHVASVENGEIVVEVGEKG